MLFAAELQLEQAVHVMLLRATAQELTVQACCCRVLKSDGIFISVTFAQPHFRKPFLLSKQFSWNISISTFGEGFHYFVYTMNKSLRTAEDQPVPFGWPSRESAVPSGFADATMQHDHMDQEDYLLRSMNL